MAKSDVLVRMKADTSGYDANIAKARRQLDQFKKDNLSMGGVLKQLNSNLLATAARFASVTAAIGAAGAAIKGNIETAKNFEKSMSQLSSLTGMVGSDLEKLKGYAIELGSSTTLSASQVADAFKMIGSQQPQLLASGEALKAVTKNAITLAEAAGIELADAAKTLSVSINQMGGDSNNAERYINVLAAAAQKGAGDIVWLGEAITKSGTTAKAVGTDYEELVANLEQLAKAGYDASTAGTALRSIIMNLEKQANNNFKPSVVGLTEAFKNLGEANLSLTEYQEMTGKMFAAQAKALADAAGEAENMKEQITGTNIAEEQAKTNTDNLDGSLKSLASAWEGLNLHINSSNGFLRTCVDWLKDVVVWADQAFTAAGRAQKQLELMQGYGGGEQTVVDKQISNLNSDSKVINSAVYKNQVGLYNKEIVSLQKQIISTQFDSKLLKIERDAMVKSLEMTVSNLQKMRDEYISRAQAILNPKTNPTATTPVDGDTDPNKTNPKKTTTTIENVKGSVADLTDQMSKLRKVQQQVTSVEGWKEIQAQIDDLARKVKIVKGELAGGFVENGDVLTMQKAQGVSVLGDAYNANKQWSADMAKTLGKELKVSLVKEEDKREVSATQEFSKMTSGIQSIVGGIEGLGIEIPEGLNSVLGGIQSMITILSGISAIVTAIEALSAADTIIPFARGGIVPHAAMGWAVPGSRYSGDTTPILANAGEVVLNRAQQGVLAAALDDSERGGGYTPSHISGEQIWIALNRYTRRTGKGELVTWR